MLVLSVSQETRNGARISALQTAENSGGAEYLPDGALSLEQDEPETADSAGLSRDKGLQQGQLRTLQTFD